MIYSSLITKKCPVCGKKFIPAPYHAYLDKRAHSNIPVCSYKCMRETEVKKKSSQRASRREYAQRRVKCIETGEVFKSAKDAALWIKAEATTIRAVCRGDRETVRGYHWAYVEE